MPDVSLSPSSPDTIRDKSVHLLLKGLLSSDEHASVGNSDNNNDRLMSLARSVETAIFEENKHDTGTPYRAAVRSHFLNMRQNPSLLKQLVEGRLSPEKFAKLSGEDLASPERKAENDRLRKEATYEHTGIDALEPVHLDEDRDQFIRTDKLIWSGGDTDRRPDA